MGRDVRVQAIVDEIEAEAVRLGGENILEGLRSLYYEGCTPLPLDVDGESYWDKDTIDRI